MALTSLGTIDGDGFEGEKSLFILFRIPVGYSSSTGWGYIYYVVLSSGILVRVLSMIGGNWTCYL